MNVGLYIAKMSVTMSGTVPRAVLTPHLPASIEELGQQIAEKVHDYIIAEKMGYYPALGYLRQQTAVDAYLLDAIDQVAGVAEGLAQQEVIKVLSPIFSSVRVNTLQCLAYGMPKVRPMERDALADLAKHYIPNSIKLELIVTLLQKTKPDAGIALAAKKMVWRWLGDVFEDLDVTTARFLGVD